MLYYYDAQTTRTGAVWLSTLGLGIELNNRWSDVELPLDRMHANVE